MWLAARLPPRGLAYLNPPDPLFKGAIRAFGLSIAARLPCPPTPARHLMMPCSALEGGACEAGGPGPRGGCGDGRNESHAECGFMKFRLQNYIIHMIVRHKQASLTKIRQKSIKKS